jgi:purine-nucleoside phosphorylase
VEKILAVARELGASEAFLTNASGGIREDLAPGTLMQIQNHLDATEPRWWLKQGGAVRGGWLSAPYDGELLERVADAARRVAVPLCRGTYAAVTGPSYETPAEVRALRSCGVDAVGMSTAHEVDVASRRGMKCTAVSCITNRAAGLPGANLDHQEVIAMAGSVAEKVRMVLEAFIGLR